MEHTANQLRQWAREHDLGESGAMPSQYSWRHGVSAYHIRVYHLVGQAIPGRDLFSMSSLVAGIAATENVAATVLPKSMSLENLEDALSLLSSVLGSRPV